MLTGIGENLNEMTSPLYGADGYIDKPFEFPQLDKRIQEALERRRAGAVGRLDGSEVDAAGDESANVDQGWSDPGTMPGVAPREGTKAVKARRPKAPSAKAKPATTQAKPRKKPAKAVAPKKAAKKPAAKAAAGGKKSAKAGKKAAKAAAKKAVKSPSPKARAKAKRVAKSAKKGKPARKGKKPAKASKPKKSKAGFAKLSAPAMKSAARTAKKARGKK